MLPVIVTIKPRPNVPPNERDDRCWHLRTRPPGRPRYSRQNLSRVWVFQGNGDRIGVSTHTVGEDGVDQFLLRGESPEHGGDPYAGLAGHGGHGGVEAIPREHRARGGDDALPVALGVTAQRLSSESVGVLGAWVHIESLVATLASEGITAAAFPADVLAPEALTKALKDAAGEFGGFEVLAVLPRWWAWLRRDDHSGRDRTRPCTA